MEIERLAALRRYHGRVAVRNAVRIAGGGEPDWNAIGIEVARQREIAERRVVARCPTFDNVIWARFTHPHDILRRRAQVAEAQSQWEIRNQEYEAERGRDEEERGLRKAIYRALRRWGFRRESGSGHGSVYYKHGSPEIDFTVRVSDHEVPETVERSSNRDNGHFTWSGAWNSLVTRIPTRNDYKLVARREVLRWLIDVRRHLIRARNL